MGLAALALTSVPGAQAATISYNFDDGTLQGWTTVMSDAGMVFGTFNGTGTPMGGSGGAHSGTYYVTSVPVSDRDLAHDTNYIRSPEFVLDNSGDLSFQLGGGTGFADLPANASDVLTATASTTSGYMGVALRRVSDGAFVLTKRRGTPNDDVWQAQSFTIGDLSPYVGGTFTLDYVDQFHGGWGWTGIDSISIPGTVVPEPSSTLAMAALGLLGLVATRGRRRKS